MSRRILLFCLVAGSLHGLDVTVNLKNGSRGNRPAQVEELRLIHLEGGMNVIDTKKNIRGRAAFRGLQASNNPYMVQAVYKGVMYSQVIPPRNKENAIVDLLVYDTTNKVQGGMTYRVFYDIRYLGEFLYVFSLIHFGNDTTSTFVEDEGGIYIHIPAAAQQVTAAVSVGSGLSNIRWLALNPVPAKQKEGAYLLAHPVKPGGKTYRLEFKIPYDKQKAEISLKDFYKRDVAFQLFVQPEDIRLSLKNFPEWVPQREEVETLQRKVIALPESNDTLLLQLAGGTSMPAPVEKPNPAQVTVSPSLTLAEKVLIPLVSIVILLFFFHYLTLKPAWLQKLRRRELDRLRQKMAQKSAGGDRADLEARIKLLEAKLT